MKSKVSELSEQIVVARELRRLRLRFTATMGGLYTSTKQARMAKASGLERGVPDLLIFEAPEGAQFVGVALEMKRAGGRPSDLRKEQREWLRALEVLGWRSLVGYGAEDALGKLCALGYDVRF